MITPQNILDYVDVAVDDLMAVIDDDTMRGAADGPTAAAYEAANSSDTSEEMIVPPRSLPHSARRPAIQVASLISRSLMNPTHPEWRAQCALQFLFLQAGCGEADGAAMEAPRASHVKVQWPFAVQKRPRPGQCG